MPANLTPIYREAEAKFKAAVTKEEKIAALEEMLSSESDSEAGSAGSAG